jgi:hypothetical protein
MSRLKDVHNSIWLALKAKDERLDGPRIAMAKPTDRYRNKTERAFALTYLDPLLFAGTIRSYAYEAIKVRLGDGAWYLPDYTVWYPDDLIQMIEVKGWLRESARIRFLVARDLFPQFSWRMVQRKQGQWLDMKV